MPPISSTTPIVQFLVNLIIRSRRYNKNVTRPAYRYMPLIIPNSTAAISNNGQTGGSGFIAAHVLDVLLERGHSVVTTVRSTEKGQKILDNYPKVSKDRLDFVLVEDVAKPGAFDKAVQSKPPFETVIHTASPFHFNVTDVKKELLDPAVIGTTGVLESTKKHAPTVKRVVWLQPLHSVSNQS